MISMQEILPGGKVEGLDPTPQNSSKTVCWTPKNTYGHIFVNGFLLFSLSGFSSSL